MKTINDLGKIITGKTPQTSHSDYFGSDIPFITPRDMKGNRKIVQTERYLSHKGARTVKNCIIPSNSVCVSCIGSDMGKVVLTASTSVTNQQINSIIIDETNDPRFVYYLMCDLSEQIKSLGKNATAVPILNKTKFSNISIDFPLLEKQKRIARMLSTYDDLIENNQNQIKLLEEAALRLYKEWFVNLRFPGYEKVKVVNGVPEGWIKQNLKEIGEIITGKTPSTTVSDYYGGTIPFVKIPDMHGLIYPIKTETTLTHKGANTQKNKYLPAGSIMVSCIATVGLVCIAHEVCQTNQQINSIILNDDSHIHYMYFKMKSIKSLLEGVGSNGATMTNVNKTKFENIEILLPEDEILRKFNEFVKPTFNSILAISRQISKLTEARDRLLPKLIRGEIEV